MSEIQEKLLQLTQNLKKSVARETFSDPVAYVYNPLAYAAPMYEAYLRRYARKKPEALFLGMNPGPFGMAQTGIPFGEVAMVRDWLKLQAPIFAPDKMHPKKPVLGLDCTRSEVSGKRLWGAIAARHPNPKTFFARAIVANYCPLLFLGATGVNLTPDKLVRRERQSIEAICDNHLRSFLDVVEPDCGVAVGVYAKACLERVAPKLRVVLIPHPSPASPKANAGWTEAARAALLEGGLSGLL